MGRILLQDSSEECDSRNFSPFSDLSGIHLVEAGNYGLRDKFGLPYVSANNVLLETSYCFHTTTAEQSSGGRDHMAHKA